MVDSESQQEFVPASEAGKRLDIVAAGLFPRFSRNRLKQWITGGQLLVDGRTCRPRDRLVGGERLEIRPEHEAASGALSIADLEDASRIPAQPLPVSLVHEDRSILVVDKSPDQVMHPAPGHRSGTLMNGLLHLDPGLARIPRAGIVHRLDKDTSGLFVVARTLEAHTSLVRQLQSRSLGRQYLALVLGDPPHSDSVDAPIGRHPRDRKRMAVIEGGKSAVTHFRVIERFDGCALLRVRLETGRTHQIRVHMTHIGLPLIGDPVYGRRRAVLPKTLAAIPLISGFARQALHAECLSLDHPESGERVSFHAPVPRDLGDVLAALRDMSDSDASGDGGTQARCDSLSQAGSQADSEADADEASEA